MRFFNRTKNDTQAAQKQQSNTNELHLPPIEARRLVRDRIMTTAATVYIHLAVSTSLDLEDDPDLSREAKAKKKADQQQKHETYKNRMKAVLGNETLFPIVSTYLLVDPKEQSKGNSSGNNSEHAISLHDAFACVALLLSNYTLLTAASGIDARVRNVLRMASIDLLAEATKRNDKDGRFLKKLQQQQQSRAKIQLEQVAEDAETPDLSKLLESKTGDPEQADQEEKKEENTNDAVYGDLYRQYATKKFQALEQAVANLMMDEMLNQQQASASSSGEESKEGKAQEGSFSRKSMVRAAKIGGVGLAAGTLFAVTGGLAAPGIAAGLAALGVSGTALTLAASPAALIALFGVGGGGLSAYKMKRRTDGLSEFEILHEDVEGNKAHLQTTVFISGWLNDEHDFQRPWGVSPSNLSRLERLQRFFSVVDPAKVNDAKELLKPYSNKDTNKDRELWKAFCMALEEQYGKTPDELLPLEDRRTDLSDDERSTLQQLFDDIMHSKNPTGSRKASDRPRVRPSTTAAPALSDTDKEQSKATQQDAAGAIRVWDYQTEFGGDIYTVQWESAMLLNMCQVVANMAKELATQATKEALKLTLMASLMAAVAWPSLFLSLANAIDNDWTLITLRSDLAGKELARSLMQSNEQRPVKLVGYSFGGRIVYACLMELAKHQIIWEEQQQDGNKWKLGSRNDKDRIQYTREPASIVQDVVMMGAPLFISRSKLRLARHMVAGRFVNCYSKKDWILSLMFQYKSHNGFMRGACDTSPVSGVNNIENYDVSELVASWHANYCRAVPDILDIIGFDQPMAIESDAKV
ncbi:MAG: hypothetical protein SGILL_007630 [Bacillariaceae sp.]